MARLKCSFSKRLLYVEELWNSFARNSDMMLVRAVSDSLAFAVHHLELIHGLIEC